VRHDYQRIYPFWLVRDSDSKRRPSAHELIYARHDRGFALISTRSTNVQRMYFQCDPKDSVDAWSGRPHLVRTPRTRDTLDGWQITKAEFSRKTLSACGSFVSRRCKPASCSSPATPRTFVRPPRKRHETWRYPTSVFLTAALQAFYERRRERKLDRYNRNCL